MQVKLLIELLLTILFFSSMVTLNFAIFKIPIKDNDKQIVLLSLIVGIVNFYFKFILADSSFLLAQIVIYLISLMIFRKYPIIYAFIVSLTGSIAVSLIDAIVTIAALRLKFSTMATMASNLYEFAILHLVSTALCFLTAFILYKLNIGFSFVRGKFSGKHSLRSYNFIWAALLIIGFVGLEFANLNFTKYSTHLYIIAIISICLLVSIAYAYFQNKKSLEDRFGEDAKKIWRKFR
jgi:hypothetical protein